MNPKRAELLNGLIKQGLISPAVSEYLNRSSLMSKYPGWTPETIDNMEIDELAAYEAIIEGESDGAKTLSPKSGSSDTKAKLDVKRTEMLKEMEKDGRDKS